jgi:hypothetical protein
MRHTDPIKNESELRCSGRTAVPASYKAFYGTKLFALGIVADTCSFRLNNFEQSDHSIRTATADSIPIPTYPQDAADHLSSGADVLRLIADDVCLLFKVRFSLISFISSFKLLLL